MKKPLIVLSPQARPMEEPFQHSYYYTNAFNMDAIRRVGGLPLLPPFLTAGEAEELLTAADGLLLTGGEDVSPSLYGQEPMEACGETDLRRDESDCRLLEAALRLKKPVLCICRGFQLANVCLGGTLYQDIPGQLPGAIGHSDYPHYGEESAHRISLLADTPLRRLLDRDHLMVNSLHHQGICRLAPALRPMAAAPDGLVEAAYLPGEDQWLWGLQWHPEMLRNSPAGERIFTEFLTVCKK